MVAVIPKGKANMIPMSQVAEIHSEYDFIFLSVRYGFVKEAVKTLRENNIKGTLVSSAISGILEKRSRSGQESTTIF